MTWFTAAQVTAVNGSDIVRIVSGELVAAIRSHDGLEIGQFNGRDILNTYTEDGTNAQIIQLVEPWPHADQTNESAQVVPSPVDFNVAAQALKQTKSDIVARYAQLYAFETQATGTVTIQGLGINDADLIIRSIPQYKINLDALEQQAQGSVDIVNAIDAQVNGIGGLVEVVAVIDGTLQGYVLSASNSASSASDDKDQTALDRVATGQDKDQTALDRIATGEDVTETNNNKLAAQQAEANAGTSESNVNSGVTLAAQYANHPEDTYIPGTTNYSSFHWNQKTESLAGGTAPNAALLDNQSPSFYAKQSDIDRIDLLLTSDDLTLDELQELVDFIKANKTTIDTLGIANIIGLSAALNLKADKTQISELDNTSDINKPISNDVNAALDVIETFAFAGMGL